MSEFYGSLLHSPKTKKNQTADLIITRLVSHDYQILHYNNEIQYHNYEIRSRNYEMFSYNYEIVSIYLVMHYLSQ